MFRLRSLALAPAVALTLGLAVGPLTLDPVADAARHGHHKHHHRPTVTLTVSTFNVLGFRHTARGGDKAKWPGGVRRMHATIKLIRRFHVEVIGFQELQVEQFKTFKHGTNGNWRLYPGGRFGNYAMHNSIAWRSHRWSVVDRDYLRIPYFHGRRINMPVVILRDARTGRKVAFANFHNPADSKGPAQKWRKIARHKEIHLARRMQAEGIPLILTGDMNERESYFCAMTARASMKAANGGGHTRNGTCVPPKPAGIDWIFGPRGVRFAEYYKIPRDDMHRVSDHPFIATRVHIRPH
jgi:endonuclease/exonuclease/phosphatase family metal-dependent hydrolase